MILQPRRNGSGISLQVTFSVFLKHAWLCATPYFCCRNHPSIQLFPHLTIQTHSFKIEHLLCSSLSHSIPLRYLSFSFPHSLRLPPSLSLSLSLMRARECPLTHSLASIFSLLLSPLSHRWPPSPSLSCSHLLSLSPHSLSLACASPSLSRTNTITDLEKKKKKKGNAPPARIKPSRIIMSFSVSSSRHQRPPSSWIGFVGWSSWVWHWGLSRSYRCTSMEEEGRTRRWRFPRTHASALRGWVRRFLEMVVGPQVLILMEDQHLKDTRSTA